MLMSKGMDEGDILAVQTTPISSEEDFAAVHDRLSLMGADLLAATLKKYADGCIEPIPQDHSAATYTGKITPDLAKIDWYKPASSIANLVRAMCPAPGAWFEDAGERIKVFRATPGKETAAEPGTVIEQQPGSGIQVACGQNSSLRLLELQRAGKSRLSCREFLCGCALKSSRLNSDERETF